VQNRRKLGQSEDAVHLQAFVSGTAEGGSENISVMQLNCFPEIFL
jgi:hypothetical protein